VPRAQISPPPQRLTSTHPENLLTFVDYLEDEGRTIQEYLVRLQDLRYVYGTDWLSHDGVDTIIHRRLSAGERSMTLEMLMRQAGRTVRIVPKLFIADSINAARSVFRQCRFDRQRCADGLQALRHYQWGPLPGSGSRCTTGRVMARMFSEGRQSRASSR